jgi:hypothetical protein|eukprot:COSAG01_NODE_3192_length_6435_cov_14.950284_7_plen_36_part_00
MAEMSGDAAWVGVAQAHHKANPCVASFHDMNRGSD